MTNYISVYPLNYYSSVLLATILEDTLMELRVLGECNTTLRLLKTHADMNTLRAYKYGVEHGPVVDELDTINFKTLDQDDNKIRKLESDRKLVTETILNTYLNLSQNRSFAFLTKTVDDIVVQHGYRTKLTVDESEHRSKRRVLAKQLRQQNNYMRTYNYDTDAVIDHLRNKIEDLTTTAETCSRYLSNWQNARSEQHIQVIMDKQTPAAQNIEYYKQQMDREQRVHVEVELLITFVINETSAKVEQWMTKYETDMEGAELKIQIMKNRYQNQIDERQDMEIKYARHSELITNWVKFKDDRAAAYAYRVKMTNSAIIVQAWWRGLMVRMKIGPYKVIKKMPSKKKK